MRPTKTTQRPEYIGDDWFRCTQGMAFAAPPPEHLRRDGALASPNPWERVVCVLLQGQAGVFQNAEALLEVIDSGSDDHLRDAAIRVFGFTARSEVRPKLAAAFAHRDGDTRLEAYTVASLTCDLALAPALARRRAETRGFERERVMDNLSNLLEPHEDSAELIDSELDDPGFERRVGEMVAELRARHGTAAIRWGAPLDAAGLASSIAALVAEEDWQSYGGLIDNMFALLEAMTGVPYAGCLDDDCTPVRPKIAHCLNWLRLGGGLDKLAPGQRVFFGHPVP